MMKIILKVWIVVVLCSYVLIAKATDQNNTVEAVSVSSDGHYALTTNRNYKAYLWDLKKRSCKQVGQGKVNPNSAYFIKHANLFMYQMLKNNQVVIQSVDGRVVKILHPGMRTSGQIITSDLSYYFASDKDNNIYRYHDGEKKQISLSWCTGDHGGEKYHGDMVHICTGGLFVFFNLSPDNKKLAASDGLGNVYMWDVKTGKGRVFNEGGTGLLNTISPDGRYLLTVDQMDSLVKYTLSKVKKTHDALIVPDRDSPLLKSYFNYKSYLENSDGTVGIKFISPKNYIVFYYNFPFVGLFSLNKDFVHHIEKDGDYYTFQPIKYIPLYPQLTLKSGKKRLYLGEVDPSMRAIDTAPTANILVMGQVFQPGIVVYHYDPIKQTLQQIWAPTPVSMVKRQVVNVLINHVIALSSMEQAKPSALDNERIQQKLLLDSVICSSLTL